MPRRTPTFTTQPDPPPPQLVCPKCDSPLAYHRTVIGGVKPFERYDQFECRTCGPFEYRQRTRHLRAVLSH